MDTYLPLGSKGEILNATVDHIDPPWDKAVTAVIDIYKKHLGDEVRSVYIDGSVVRGTATPYKSDLDSSCVTYSDSKYLDLSWMKEARQEFKQKFPFADKVELTVYSLQEVLEQKHHARMILKTLAKCVYGENIQGQLPDVFPDTHLAWAVTRNFGKFLDLAIERINEHNNPEVTRWNCRWMSKRIVRAGFALVMPQEKQLTLDLVTSAEVFSRYYLDYQDQMRQALAWCTNPIENKTQVLDFFQSFGKWLESELAKEITHNP